MQLKINANVQDYETGLILDNLKDEIDELKLGTTKVIKKEVQDGTLAEPVTITVILTSALLGIKIVREIIALVREVREKRAIETNTDFKKLPEFEIELDDKKFEIPKNLKEIEEQINDLFE